MGGSAPELRRYLYELLERDPAMFERMAMRSIRRYRPVLGVGDALSISADAIEAVARYAEREPVRCDTALGLVQLHMRWAASDLFRQLRPRREIPGGLGVADSREDGGGDLLARTALALPALDVRAAAVLREADELALRLWRLAGGDVEPAPDGPDGPARRKRLERSRSRMVAWARGAIQADRARWLEQVILGDRLPPDARRGRNGRLLAWLGLDGLPPPATRPAPAETPRPAGTGARRSRGAAPPRPAGLRGGRGAPAGRA
jgi:hypothetical protein